MLAGVLMGAQTLTLVVVTVLLLINALGSAEGEVGRLVTLAAVAAAFAVGAGFLARALVAGLETVRTPVLLWNAFVILTGVELARGGAPAIGTVVSVVAVITLVAGWFATVDHTS